MKIAELLHPGQLKAYVNYRGKPPEMVWCRACLEWHGPKQLTGKPLAEHRKWDSLYLGGMKWRGGKKPERLKQQEKLERWMARFKAKYS